MPKELRSDKQALAYLRALGEKGVKAQFELMMSKAFKTSTLQKWRANFRRIRNFASPGWSLFNKALNNIINRAEKPRGNLSRKLLNSWQQPSRTIRYWSGC
jgi:hypothetical protein